MLTLALLAPPVTSATASDLIRPTQASLRYTFETLKLPHGETLGYLGQTGLFDLGGNWRAGIATYGALTGNRGGFICLGFAGEVHGRLTDDGLETTLGGFVGAGGGRGGYRLSGGGLMLRGHAGLAYPLGRYLRLGAGISYVDFPDGAIHSGQPYVQLDIPFKTTQQPGWSSSPTTGGHETQPEENHQTFAITYREYDIPKGVLTDNGKPQFPLLGLVGIEWSQALDHHLFFRLESEGAFRGNSHGYMQILTGLGAQWSPFAGTTIKIYADAGVAGGGNVDTGGGLLLDANLALEQQVKHGWFLAGSVGRVRAPGRTFHATSWAIKTGRRFHTPDLPESGSSISLLNTYRAERYRIRMTHQVYQKADRRWRTHHANLDFRNLGLKVDYFPTTWFFLTGQGIAAYSGKAGAYMTGLLGAGIHVPVTKHRLFFEAEGLAGGAGGGGVSVGGGLVWQANALLGLALDQRFSLMAGFGRMESPKGHFKVNVISMELAYRFRLLIR